MEPWQVEARVEIADLVGRYAWGVDGARADDIAQLFTEGAEFDTGGGDLLHGSEAVRAYFTAPGMTGHYGAGSPITYVRHHVSNHVVDLTDETHAEGRCYFVVTTDRGLEQWGRYFDRYERMDGGWRFAARKIRMDGFTPPAA